MPWSKRTEDVYDIPKAKEILEADHYDLEKVKDRILEFLAVRKMKPDIKGPILCFMGPPGVGKTSLGKSIAKALGRKFARISLGGIRDEAEIRGHRRTYIGGTPRADHPEPLPCRVQKPGVHVGRDRQARNGLSGAIRARRCSRCSIPSRTTPSGIITLTLPFDLSEVLFIATANILDPVPPALKDRMEVIHLAGYTEEEKDPDRGKASPPAPARKSRAENRTSPPRFTREALAQIIRHYTQEAGLRKRGALHRHDLPQGGEEVGGGRHGTGDRNAGLPSGVPGGPDVSISRDIRARQGSGSRRRNGLDAGRRRHPVRRGLQA